MFIIKFAIMKKTEALEKLISILGISKSELENWFIYRNNLPLVYCDKLRVKYGLEKLISKLEISESELRKWFYDRGQNNENKVNRPFENDANFIPTKLPLVYYHNNELIVKCGLDLSCKKELSGIQLLPGVIFFLQHNWRKISWYGSGIVWETAKNYAKGLCFNGKIGRLPSRYVLERHWSCRETTKLEATLKVLKENKIEVRDYGSWEFWCSEEKNLYDAYYFNLFNFNSSLGDRNSTYCCDYLAVAFN